MSKKFATLSDTKKEADRDSGSEDSDDKDDKREAFYVGGGEKSGQQVLGPSKSSKEDFINKLFQRARQHGAEEVDASQSQPSTAASASSGRFSGAGIRLGDAASGPSMVPGPESSVDPRPRPVRVKIQLWQNGFVLEDGPLRNYEDPENKLVLDSIMQNRVPRELLMKYRGAPIEVDLENHRLEQYKPPKVAAQPFQGQGHVLGSPTPTVVGAGTVGVKVSQDAAPKPAETQPARVDIDETKPTTNIQIRLADGTRLVSRFNVTHRISDVREFIVDSHPASAFTPFVLLTLNPKKELMDETKTLQEADLMNVVVVQFLKPD